MFNFIEKIRNKPEKTKTKIAFFTSFVFTGIIFTFWLVAVYPDFKEDIRIEKKIKKLEPSPVSTMGSILGDNISKIKEQVVSIKNITSSLNDKEVYYKATTTPTSTTTVQSD